MTNEIQSISGYSAWTTGLVNIGTATTHLLLVPAVLCTVKATVE